jgi:hypothetical protein
VRAIQFIALHVLVVHRSKDCFHTEGGGFAVAFTVPGLGCHSTMHKRIDARHDPFWLIQALDTIQFAVHLVIIASVVKIPLLDRDHRIHVQFTIEFPA